MFDINSLWYGIVQSLLQLIDGINAVFYWLAGIRPASQYPADGVQDFDNRQAV
ncbi:MAG: hypothetical protein RR993_03265 [Clostridia bacterium]